MPKKGEKLSPEQAEKLKKAREKALATRRKNAEIRKKEKLVKDLEKQKKSKDLDKTIENIKMETDEHGGHPRSPPKYENRGQRGVPAKRDLSKEECESLDEMEQEVEYVRKPKKAKRKPKKIVYVEDSDSSDEDLDEKDIKVVYKKIKREKKVAEKEITQTPVENNSEDIKRKRRVENLMEQHKNIF